MTKQEKQNEIASLEKKYENSKELEKLKALKPYLNLRTIAAKAGINYMTLTCKMRKPKQSLTEEQAAAVKRVLSGIVEIIIGGSNV